MSTIAIPSPPTQAGVQYEAAAAPVFAVESSVTPGTYVAGALVPNGDSFTLKQAGATVESMDETADVANFGTSNHHLVATGDFYLKAGVDVKKLSLGMVVQDSETTPRNWIIATEPEETGFSAGGKPLTVKLELRFYPKIDAAI